ncbi:hypothetical protein BDM02DRAFT_2351326 [Thelephora ganbajun]|uniref:Uncharacterized protein n=1 Tax=Thelephora ganbajun TaxID=370292 RepID=A0ACB6ZFD2_THEGA|nr:hypothetical protein BDM02DRAFT_2351326 [Thelephora ganbajun]
MEALAELKEKTRESRRSLMATTVLVDASVATRSEWLSVVTDYVGPQLNHIAGKFLDHQVCNTWFLDGLCLPMLHVDFQLRTAFVTYGLPSTRPSPILCKRYFSKLEVLKRDSLETPELVGLGQISNEESETYGTAMLDAFACALEMFDLLDATPSSSSTHILRQIVHVATYPSDNARHPAWNVNPDLDHLSWSNLPQELRKRDIHYSSFLIRPLPQLERFHAAVCPNHETSPPWFEVRPHHKCLLWVPADPMENIMAILNSTTPPIDFSPQEYQQLIEKYLILGQENDRLVNTIRSGSQVDLDHIKQVLQTDFPLYARLQDYFSRLRAGDSKSVDQTSFVPEDPVYGGGRVLSHSVDVNVERDPEMQLASECDPEAMSMFFGTEGSTFTERPPAVPNQGPFGIRFSDFPPRVISQMLSIQTDVAAPSSSWQGSFTWAGFEHASRAKKFMRVPMIGLSATNGKDLRAHTWPQNMILLPSGTKRVNDAALQDWIKRYDPVWCQFVPHHSKGGNDAVMNDLVYRQLVQRLIDHTPSLRGTPKTARVFGTLSYSYPAIHPG